MRADGKCRSCGAPIRWARTEATGARMPLDSAAVVGGNLSVVQWNDLRDEGRTFAEPVVAIDADDRALTPTRYVSHFTTCPRADHHRRNR